LKKAGIRAEHGMVVRAFIMIFSLMPVACSLAGPVRAKIAALPARLRSENVAFASKSGSSIHAWLIRGKPGAGAVLLLHGQGSNRMSMQGRAEFLGAQGFTVLAPDFQAHGESPGEHVTFGALESLDAAAAIAFLRTAVPHELVGVIGVSMGGAAALLGDGPLHADAFVLESVYPTIRQAVSDRLDTWFWPFGWFGRLLTPAMINIVGSEAGVTEAQLQPIAHIGSIKAPLLMLAGTVDQYTPLLEAEALYARAPAPKTFWAVEGAGHVDLYDFGRPEYEKRVGGFLEQYLQQKGTKSDQ
jgi:fermentation-respiration switch protein FrsA (DUF1100 family)